MMREEGTLGEALCLTLSSDLMYVLYGMSRKRNLKLDRLGLFSRIPSVLALEILKFNLSIHSLVKNQENNLRHRSSPILNSINCTAEGIIRYKLLRYLFIFYRRTLRNEISPDSKR